MHEQVVDVHLPQKMKESVELVRCPSATPDRRTGDQACRVSADTRHIDKVAEVPVKMQRQVPQMRQVTKHVENPRTQLIGKVVGQSSR